MKKFLVFSIFILGFIALFNSIPAKVEAAVCQSNIEVFAHSCTSSGVCWYGGTTASGSLSSNSSSPVTQVVDSLLIGPEERIQIKATHTVTGGSWHDDALFQRRVYYNPNGSSVFEWDSERRIDISQDGNAEESTTVGLFRPAAESRTYYVGARTKVEEPNILNSDPTACDVNPLVEVKPTPAVMSVRQPQAVTPVPYTLDLGTSYTYNDSTQEYILNDVRSSGTIYGINYDRTLYRARLDVNGSNRGYSTDGKVTLKPGDNATWFLEYQPQATLNVTADRFPVSYSISGPNGVVSGRIDQDEEARGGIEIDSWKVGGSTAGRVYTLNVSTEVPGFTPVITNSKVSNSKSGNVNSVLVYPGENVTFTITYVPVTLGASLQIRSVANNSTYSSEPYTYQGATSQVYLWAQCSGGSPGGVILNPRGDVLESFSDLEITDVPDTVSGLSIGQPGYYSVRCNNNQSASVRVERQNAVPIARNDAYEDVLPNTIQMFDVLRNDSDPDGHPLTIVSTSAGTIVNNRISLMTPSSGNRIFTYTISDGQGGTSTATVYVTVRPIAAAMNAEDDMYTLQVGQTQMLEVLSNDSGQAPLSLVSLGAGAPSFATISGSAIRFVAPNTAGVYTFTYTARAADGQTDNATVTVTVVDPNAVNEPVRFNVITRDTTGRSVNGQWTVEYSHNNQRIRGVGTDLGSFTTVTPQAQLGIRVDTTPTGYNGYTITSNLNGGSFSNLSSRPVRPGNHVTFIITYTPTTPTPTALSYDVSISGLSNPSAAHWRVMYPGNPSQSDLAYGTFTSSGPGIIVLTADDVAGYRKTVYTNGNAGVDRIAAGPGEHVSFKIEYSVLDNTCNLILGIRTLTDRSQVRQPGQKATLLWASPRSMASYQAHAQDSRGNASSIWSKTIGGGFTVDETEILTDDDANETYTLWLTGTATDGTSCTSNPVTLIVGEGAVVNPVAVNIETVDTEGNAVEAGWRVTFTGDLMNPKTGSGDGRVTFDGGSSGGVSISAYGTTPQGYKNNPTIYGKRSTSSEYQRISSLFVQQNPTYEIDFRLVYECEVEGCGGNEDEEEDNGGNIDVTLDALPKAVRAGGGITTLSWGTVDAVSCTGSSNPSHTNWSGSKSTANNGSESMNIFIDRDTTFTITCEDAEGNTDSDSVTVTVNPPSFTLAAQDSLRFDTIPGDSTSAFIYVVPESGFTSPVTLSIESEPFSATYTFSDPTLSSNEYSQGSGLSAYTDNTSLADGEYDLIVKGVGNGITRYITIGVIIDDGAIHLEEF